MDLTAAQRKFVLHWGEMGVRWGINRTVAQIHALLFVAPRPLHAEEIADTLEVARSNVSTSLRELQGWGIIRIVHVMGDRRDHFESMKDVWEMFMVVLTERKRREIDPTLEILRQCVAEARRSPGDAATERRLTQMLDFFQAMSDWYEQVRKLPMQALARFVRAGSRLRKALGVA